MAPIHRSSQAQLERRLAQLIRELEAVAPVLVQEMLMLQSVIEQRKNVTVRGTEFANTRGPRKAVEMALVESGTWMTKQQIADRLIEGGFNVTEAVAGRALIDHSINYLLKTGKVVSCDELTGKNKLIGLPGWPHPIKS